jgi:hypothetical protein
MKYVVLSSIYNPTNRVLYVEEEVGHYGYRLGNTLRLL